MDFAAPTLIISEIKEIEQIVSIDSDFLLLARLNTYLIIVRC